MVFHTLLEDIFLIVHHTLIIFTKNTHLLTNPPSLEGFWCVLAELFNQIKTPPRGKILFSCLTPRLKKLKFEFIL